MREREGERGREEGRERWEGERWEGERWEGKSEGER